MNIYSTTYSNGYVDLTVCPAEAFDYINYDDAQVFSISGKPVTAEYFFAEAQYYKAQQYPRGEDFLEGVRRSFHE
jgi:uncharacterized protein with LGFP repeats